MSAGITDWIEFNHKNKPQGNALAAGIMILIVSGMQVGWIFNNDLMNFPWAKGHSSLQVIFTYVSFYIAATAGLYLASMVVNRLTKKNIYVSCSMIEINCGLFIEIFLVLCFDVCIIWVDRLYRNAKKSLSVVSSEGYDRIWTWLHLPHCHRACI